MGKQIDTALCEAYLDMPASHTAMAQKALAWLEQDTLGNGFLRAARDAFERRDHSAANVCIGAKEYAMRNAPEVAEGVVPALFALALPGAIERLRGDGLDENMICDTLRDYGIWARFYERQMGRPGIGEISWETCFLIGRIYKIGRLEYEFGHTYRPPYTIYRDLSDGALVPVPNAGVEVDAQGFLALGAPAAFTTVCEEKDGLLRYNQVDTEHARIVPQIRTTPVEQLEPLITGGMQVLNIHIPECGPLSEAQVQSSLEQAQAFFAARGLESRIAICESWLLDPALLAYGADCSNIVSFQQRFTKYPECTMHSAAVSRVFGRGTDETQVEALAEDTRLRRGLKQYLRAGGVLRDAGGVLNLKSPQ